MTPTAPEPGPDARAHSALAPGTLLLSAPDLLDPNFMHTVVLLCQHSEEGAFGVVVNRLSPATIGDLLPEHEWLGADATPVHGGGPVGLDSLQILHRAPKDLEGGHHVAGGVHLGAELDQVVPFLTGGDAARSALKFVVGYSGWSAGQLDAELASGSWVPRPLDVDLVFSDEPAETVWRRALRSIGGDGAGLASLPPDPTWN